MGLSNVQIIDTGYRPRPLQAALHRKLRRFNVLAIHRRFGKTVLAINELIDRGLSCPLNNPHMSYIAPFYKQAKNVAWEYLKEFTFKIPGVRQLESELLVEIPLGPGNNLRIQLFGADHPDSMRGTYHDHVVFDEFGLQPESIWSEVIRPALADRKGGATFLGTVQGKNNFHTIFRFAQEREAMNDPEWFTAVYRADQTNVIDPVELEAARREMPEDKFRSEFLCDWGAGIQGAYYSSEMSRVNDEGRICRVPHETKLPVFVSFDLGYNDFNALWYAQFFRGEVRLIEYEQFPNTSLESVLKDMMQKPYSYAELFMPWDIEVHESFNGLTRREQVEAMGFTVNVAPKKVSKADGINAVRMLLPKCVFDKEGTAPGIDCLENFRKKIDPRTGQFLSVEQKDDFVHGADAFRYLAVCYEERFGNARLDASRKYAGSTGMGKVIRSV